MDVAIEGDGYFAVIDRGQSRLTRNGQFAVDRKGSLILSNGDGQAVLDPKGKPIRLLPSLPTRSPPTARSRRPARPSGRIGVFDVADRTQLLKQGGTLLVAPRPAARPRDRLAPQPSSSSAPTSTPPPSSPTSWKPSASSRPTPT